MPHQDGPLDPKLGEPRVEPTRLRTDRDVPTASGRDALAVPGHLECQDPHPGQPRQDMSPQRRRGRDAVHQHHRQPRALLEPADRRAIDGRIVLGNHLFPFTSWSSDRSCPPPWQGCGRRCRPASRRRRASSAGGPTALVDGEHDHTRCWHVRIPPCSPCRRTSTGHGQRSARVAGPGASTSSRRAASMTLRCCTRLPTGPTVRPINCGVTSTCGTCSRPATCAKARMKTETVGTPCSSRALLRRPTDPWQTGQVATNKQASTPSARSCCAHCGATCSRSRTCDVAPVKL